MRYAQVSSGKRIDLPANYDSLTSTQRKKVREQYVEMQDGKCYYCETPLDNEPPEIIRNLKIEWRAFPPNFLRYPVHLQHCHSTGMTEGAVHAYCNAVMWQYEGR